jgi:hypothetical protein
MDATCGAGTNYPSRSHDFLSDVVCDARSLVFFVVLLYIIVSPFALLYCMFVNGLQIHVIADPHGGRL